VKQATNVDAIGTLSEIAEIVSGEMVGSDTEAITRVDIDSRTSTKGTLFVPLPGTRTDGHRFIGDAFDNGATACFASRRVWEAGRPEDATGAVIVVEDPLAALQALAADRRRRRSDVAWVGITGSNGKTTTKEILAAILTAAYGSKEVYWSQGNYNSEIGLPLSLLEVDSRHRVAVLEMAMNNPGEMELLTSIARPTRAIITNIGDAHIGNLGSRDAIAEEKRKIFNHLGPDGVAFVHESEPYREFLTEPVEGRVLAFGQNTTPGHEGADLIKDGWRIRRREGSTLFALPGRHNLRNALAAVSVAVDLGVGEHAILRGLAEARPVTGRSELIAGGISVVNDSYNANPDSMAAAFDFFREIEVPGRKIVVLGEMGELGKHADEGHRRVLVDALSRGFPVVVTVGEAYPRQGAESRHRSVRGVAEAEAVLEGVLQPGDAVLLKGSRTAALERLIPVISRIAS
jgi:UDP-N-acetylmuramoyl-tripeptide--D-alanyl-D-alanine ligase